MTTSQATPRSASVEVEPALVLRTGRADGCRAHFHPELYQLVLRRDGFEEKIDLGYSGSRLLERLLRFPGEVVPRDELLAHAWSDRVVGQGSLNQQVYTLRQVLADEKSREIIQTLPRRGYMLNPKYLVNPADTPTPSTDELTPLTPSTMPPTEQPLVSQPWQRFLLVGLTLTALALLAAVYIYHSLFSVEVLVQERDIGNKHFTYANPNQDGLRALQADTQALSQRLAALSEQPARFRLGKTSDFYEMLCERADGKSHWMIIHESQIATVSTEQLRSCLQ